MADVVYINDNIVDIGDSVIAWTIQRIEIGDITKNSLSYSNTIKAPKTPNNNLNFGYSNIAQSTNLFPYQLQECRVIQNGVQTIRGKAIITDVGNSYSIVIYDDFISLVSFIKDKNIAELTTWGNIAWTQAGIDAARLNTSGFLTAVCNWGRSSIYEVNYFLPVYYYYSLIQDILKTTGYSLSGTILSSNDFKDLVCTPVNVFKYVDFGSNATKYTATSSSQSLTLSIDQAYLSIIYPTNNYGIIPFIDTFLADVLLNVRFINLNQSINVFSASNCDIRIYGSISGLKATSAGIILNYINTDVTYNFTNVEFLKGETIEIRLYFNKDAGYPTDSVFVDIGTAGNGTSFTITDLPSVARSKPYWSRLVDSSIKMESVIKDFFVRFGIVYKLEGSNLVLKTLEEICTDQTNAVDWTNKRVTNDGDLISFKTSYAQVNNFKYNDNVGASDLGKGVLTIVNNVLNSVKDYFSTLFKNAEKYSGSIDCFTLPVYDSTSTGIDDIKIAPPFILATLRNRVGEPAITFDAVARTDYKIAHFVSNQQTKDTGFQYFINKYYKTFSAALQTNKVCTYKYLLTELDIANYDPHKMIYDNGSYYLINKISNFRSGKVTTVELFKIQ